MLLVNAAFLLLARRELADSGEQAEQAECGGDGSNHHAATDEVEVGDDGKNDKYGAGEGEAEPGCLVFLAVVLFEACLDAQR